MRSKKSEIGNIKLKTSKIKALAFYFCFYVCFLLIIGTAICRAEGKYTGGPHYFRDIRSSKPPYEPIEVINYEEANNLYTYYEAYFNGQGRIISLKKYEKGILKQVLMSSDKK
ncbi:MAG: hypothetical protein HZB80_07550 [Deltaproteobacteria bacterium]|nr:hypothetical protein [Deltaproteobacteria bacterium]